MPLPGILSAGLPGTEGKSISLQALHAPVMDCSASPACVCPSETTACAQPSLTGQKLIAVHIQRLGATGCTHLLACSSYMTCVELWSNGTDLLKVLGNTQQCSTDAGDVAVDAGARLMGLDYQGWADA